MSAPGTSRETALVEGDARVWLDDEYLRACSIHDTDGKHIALSLSRENREHLIRALGGEVVTPNNIAASHEPNNSPPGAAVTSPAKPVRPVLERQFRFDVTSRSRFEILAAYKVLVEHYHPDQGWALYGTWEFGRGFGARPADKSEFEHQLMIGRQCASLLLHFGEQL